MGQRFHQMIRKNEGSALILVLLCMTFLGLLGSVILTATVSNRKMKAVDVNSKDNFYTTESVVDELKVGLEEVAQNHMKEAYSYMLQRYSTTPDSERTTLLMRRFVSLLYDDLAIHNSQPTHSYESSQVDDIELKKNYLLSSTSQQAQIASSGGITVIKDFNDLSVTLKNVSIRYTDVSGYESTITTDIKIKATFPSLSTRAVNNAGIYYRDYALIADDIIQKDGANLSTVTGNIYGGAGISATDEGSVLKLNSQKVISREALEAIKKAQIIIPVREDGLLVNSVWVNNIATSSTEDASTIRDYLDITANCYVKDDLTLNAKYGRVKLAGNYYGYQIGNLDVSDQKASMSSSISINARNAELDLSDVSNLWISGKSYLSIPNIYGSSSKQADRISEVLEGESISFKGDQVAYLVPGNCIVGIGHNPMTRAEYKLLEDLEDYKVDITLNKGIELEKYVDKSANNSYTAHHVRYFNDNETMEMVYLYLKFQSPDLASEYFFEYQNLYKDKLKNNAFSLQLGNVIMPNAPETLVHSGTILKYTAGSKESLNYTNRRKLTATYDIKISSSAAELQTKQDEYATRYNGLISCLNEEYRGNTSISLVKNLIRYEDDDIGIKSVAQAMRNDPTKNTYDIYEEDNEVTKTYILVTGRPETETIVLDSTKNGRSGLVIATCDVVVQDCNFTGLIITTGKIFLKANANVNAAPEMVKNIIDTRPEVSRFLYDYIPSGSGSSGDTNTIQITYENWFKE